MKKAVSIFLILIIALGAGLSFHFSHSTKKAGPIENHVLTQERPKKNSDAIATQASLQTQIVNSAHSSPEVVSAEQKKIQLALQHVREKSRTPSAQMKSVPEKLTFNSSLDARWKLWPTVRAVPQEQVQAADAVVGEMKRFRLVSRPTQESSLKEFHKDAMPVVYDSRLKMPGLVTGMIKIVTANKGELTQDLDKQNAYISNAFENINTYYVTSYQSIFDLETLYQTLKAKSYTQNIEIDIVDRDYDKK